MNVCERVGRREEALAHEIRQRLLTIALLRRIKEGDVDAAVVVVNERGWQLAVAKEPGLELRTTTDIDGHD